MTTAVAEAPSSGKNIKIKEGDRNVSRLQNIASEIASNMSASGHEQSYLQSKVSDSTLVCCIRASSCYHSIGVEQNHSD